MLFAEPDIAYAAGALASLPLQSFDLSNRVRLGAIHREWPGISDQGWHSFLQARFKSVKR